MVALTGFDKAAEFLKNAERAKIGHYHSIRKNDD